MNDFLRERLGLTGTKFGCGAGQCLSCAVIIDDPDGTSHTSPTCIVPAASFNGKSIRTVEGHATNGELTALQRSFIDHFAFQCGYCTAGFLNEGQVLLERLAGADGALISKTIATRLAGICAGAGYIKYRGWRDVILANPGRYLTCGVHHCGAGGTEDEICGSRGSRGTDDMRDVRRPIGDARNSKVCRHRRRAAHRGFVYQLGSASQSTLRQCHPPTIARIRVNWAGHQPPVERGPDGRASRRCAVRSAVRTPILIQPVRSTNGVSRRVRWAGRQALGEICAQIKIRAMAAVRWTRLHVTLAATRS
jgi:aerobic-type carbon monoxide dehydrogenase small subunit (CoxS/CutS family)